MPLLIRCETTYLRQVQVALQAMGMCSPLHRVQLLSGIPAPLALGRLLSERLAVCPVRRLVRLRTPQVAAGTARAEPPLTKEGGRKEKGDPKVAFSHLEWIQYTAMPA